MSTAFSSPRRALASLLFAAIVAFALPALSQAAQDAFIVSRPTPLDIARAREALTQGGPFDPTPERASAPWISSGVSGGDDAGAAATGRPSR